MAVVVDHEGTAFDITVDVLIVGAGAAGLTAALRAAERGLSVLVIERDAVPRGSTSLSAGLIPAAATRFQRDAGIADSIPQFSADIMRKAHDEPDPVAVDTVTTAIGPAIEWLADKHKLPFSVITNFTYPGHSAMRMHGLPSRSGTEVMDRLRTAAETAGIDILTEAVATTIIRQGPRTMAGLIVSRPDGQGERIGCGALILACNGYGGNPAQVRAHMPEMADALYFGHAGNQGDAIRWGAALGAATRHLSGYQGHGSVAHPHGILVTWATITEGGFQVSSAGQRFANEMRGYSEAAASVIAQPGAIAWTIFDQRIAAIAAQFEDFRSAQAQGAVVHADTVEVLATKTGLPVDALRATFTDVVAMKQHGATDNFGRAWTGAPPLAPPYAAVRVTGAVFHTQGGLVVDREARVCGTDGVVFTNLFAAGGAACGVSGADASGYLSGNGLLTAVAYGYIAGASVLAD